MASLDVIRRIQIRAEAEGFEDAARKLQSLGRAEEGLVATSERTERATGRVEQSFRRIEGSLDPVARALQQYERTQRTVQAAQAQGVTSQARANELIGAAESRVIAAATATERFAEAHKGLSAQSQAALHSIRSVAEQVALGISPVQALTGQINHLSFAATGEGGLKGAFAGLGPVLSGALRFVNPLTVGLAAVGGAALAANRALDQQHEARVATTGGLGRFGQATAADVGAIATRAAGNGVSIGQAREAVLAFTRAGVESNEVIERGTKIVQRYAATFGGEFADAQKELAGLAAEPGKAIDAVAKRAGIDADITNHIKLLDSLGNTTGAAKEAFDALDKALVRDADASTDAGRAKAYLSTQLTKSLDVAGRIALMQQPSPESDAGQRAAGQAAAVARPGFAGAVRGETSRGQAAVSPDLIASNAATAQALEAESRGLRLVEFRQTAVTEAIRKGTEAHQLDLAAIHAHTAEEQSGVAITRTFLELQDRGVKDAVARAAATEAGEKVLAQHNQQQEDAVRIGKANVDVIRALGGEQVKAAAAAEVLAVRSDDYAGAQTKVNQITAQQDVAERNRTLQHQANLQSITAVTQAEVEAAAGQQAYTAAILSQLPASAANKAASQAMAEERAKDVAAAGQITRAHEANMKAIVALTTEEKANAAASVAAAGQREGSMAAATAATAAYAEEVAKAAVVQRDFDRQLAASQGNAMREATAQLQAAQVRPGPGAQAQRGQIQATAAAQSQISTIQAQNPNIQIDTGAFVQASQAVAALGESARQASVALNVVQASSAAIDQLNISTAQLNGQITAAQAAFMKVTAATEAQITAQGLQGAAADEARNAGAAQGQASARNVEAQQAASARAAEAADLASRNQTALARSAQMAASGLTGFTSDLAKVIHHTTASVEELNGKLIGEGMTITGALTEYGVLLQAADDRRQMNLVRAQKASDDFEARHANDNALSASRSISDPISGLVQSAQSRLESAQEAVTSAQKSAEQSAKSAPMANATQADPSLDPYLSRNASVYYGSATQQFYKEISWQEASLNAANQSLDTDQEALQTAQQELAAAQAQYDQLKAIADSANRMAANTDPAALGSQLAKSLAAAGFAKTGQDVADAAKAYAQSIEETNLQAQVKALSTPISTINPYGSPYVPARPGFSSQQPFTPLQDVALKPHAAGADLILPGTGGEQPYMVSAQPGERLRISPRGDSGGGVTVVDNRVTHVYGVTQPENVAARLESDAKNRVGYSGAAMRAARLAA